MFSSLNCETRKALKRQSPSEETKHGSGEIRDGEDAQRRWGGLTLTGQQLVEGLLPGQRFFRAPPVRSRNVRKNLGKL